MSTKPPRRRKSAPADPGKPVKCTVMLDVETHTKLAAAAAMNRCDRSTFAAAILREGLKGIVAFDRNRKAEGPAKTSDRVHLADVADAEAGAA